ncbi:Phosphotransferase family protein [Candidatus Sulfopaludibacter sp. SbA4]|nr:Phosphotransferase family protein [Candidatus Sulfopaludibacter sp. SbA4]
MPLLTADNLAYYLLEKGYISRDSVVEGDYLVLDYQRRNRNFKVIRRNQPGYFVKQVLKVESEPIATLQREASCYWLAQTQPPLAPLRRISPGFRGYDRARHVLVVELLDGAETLSDYYRRLERLPENIAAEAGRLLSSYHSDAGAWIMESPYQSVFARVTPWILSMHQIPPEYYPVLSEGNGRLLEIVKGDPEFPQTLDALRAEWRVNSLLHGDIKWENFLVHGATLKLVDWEMADLGDACWDVGAFLQNFLVFWVLALPLDAYGDPAQAVDMAQYPLDQMHRPIRSFWLAYIGARGFSDSDANEFLMRTIRFGAARMIQSAFECLYFAKDMTAQAICLLQLSLNILKDPEAARQTLLGL